MERNEDDWTVECSDEEKYEVDPKVKHQWLVYCFDWVFSLWFLNEIYDQFYFATM